MSGEGCRGVKHTDCSLPLVLVVESRSPFVVAKDLMERLNRKEERFSDGARSYMGFVMLLGQFSKVAVDVVRIAAFGVQLNGHVLDAEIRGDPVLDQL